MARCLSALILCACLPWPSLTQLTPEQKVSDLRQIEALYAKNYAPHEWKKLAFGYDLFELQPWIDRALATQSDIEFWDLLIDYIANLQDGHDYVSVPANFSASLGFSVDLYDWKPIIDWITRSRLPESRYPFQIGDELVLVDGVPVQDWTYRLLRYSMTGNPRSSIRRALGSLVSRSQSRIPWAHEIGDTAEIVVLRANGNLETYTIPWAKSGFPITFTGPVPNPAEKPPTVVRAAAEPVERNDNLEPWQKPLAHLLVAMDPVGEDAVLNYGTVTPVFTLPSNFQQRMGKLPSDVFYSGVYESEGLRIGFIRIPSYNPAPGVTEALRQFDIEIAWMQANTDGLVIDDMRNPGGYVNYVEDLCRRLIPYRFRSIGFEVRATMSFVNSFGGTWYSIRNSNQPEEIKRGYEERYLAVLNAYQENHGRTPPVSLTGPTLDLDPVKDASGKILAYSKPMIVLVDDFSASGGDAFPATIQDNARAPIVGMRTMGLGGSVMDFVSVANYTEANSRVTVTQMNRKYPIVTAEFPAAPYVENIGVRPDVEIDYMTRENLMAQGKPFVDAFTRAIVDHIRKSAN